jgi:hypothetical protein
MKTDLPTDEEVLGVVRCRGCLTLRALCDEIWPGARWRGGAGRADSKADVDSTVRALLLWEALGRLMATGQVRVAGCDADESDALAAVAFELVGQKPHYAA